MTYRLSTLRVMGTLILLFLANVSYSQAQNSSEEKMTQEVKSIAEAAFGTDWENYLVDDFEFALKRKLKQEVSSSVLGKLPAELRKKLGDDERLGKAVNTILRGELYTIYEQRVAQVEYIEKHRKFVNDVVENGLAKAKKENTANSEEAWRLGNEASKKKRAETLRSALENALKEELRACENEEDKVVKTEVMTSNRWRDHRIENYKSWRPPLAANFEAIKTDARSLKRSLDSDIDYQVSSLIKSLQRDARK